MKGYDGKVILFTTFYNRQTISNYAESLYKTALVLERLGIKQDYWASEGGFLIEVALDQALTKFSESDATDFLIIDSDEAWNPAAVVMLLMHTEPIVCGTYRKKNAWAEYIGDFKKTEDGHVMGVQKNADCILIEADRIPAGFLRIKKEVILKYIEKYPEHYYINGEKIYSFFKNEIINNQFTSMDYVISDKFKKLGYQIWIDPALEIDHFGLTEYKGNFDKYLRGLKAIEDVKKMATNIKGVV